MGLRIAPASVIALALAGAPAAQDEVLFQSYRAHVAAAESALRLGDPAAARAWLDGAPGELRGFEWRALDASLDESLWTARIGADDDATISALALSPDGERLVCALASGELQLRAAADGSVLAALGRRDDWVYDVHFDATGERVSSACQDGSVRIQDAAGGDVLVDFRGHRFPCAGGAFHPDGRLVASSSYERPPGTVVGTVLLWDSADGTVIRTLEGGRKPLVDVAFSPDGTRVAAASWDFCVFVWDVEGGEPRKLAVPDEGLYNAVDGVAWSPDGRWIAGGSKDETARVWRAEDGELAATLRGHTDHVGAVAFSPDGALLATASSDSSVRLWSTQDWSERAVLRGHAAAVSALAWSPDGRRLLTGSADGTLKSWDATALGYGGVRLRASDAAYRVRFSPDGRRLASCGYDGRVQVWNACTWEPLAAWQAHERAKSCHMLEWGPEGTWLASGSYETGAKLWDADTLELLATLEHPGGLYDLRVSPDGALLATACGEKVFVWDARERSLLHELDHGKFLLALAFSPDSTRLASCGRDGRVALWDPRAGELRSEIRIAGDDAAACVFLPDGIHVAVADRSGPITLHRVEDGALVRRLRSGGHGATFLAASPAGRWGQRIAASPDVVLLLDPTRTGELGRFRPHVESPYDLTFDPTGDRLVSCSTDATLAVVDTRPLRERLAERDRERAALVAAEAWLDAELAGGHSLEEACRGLRQAPATPATGPRRDAVLRRSAAARDDG